MRCKTIAVSMFLIILCVAPTFADTVAPPVRCISTSGRGEVAVVPDKITVSFGVTSRHTDLDLAKQNNDKRTADVLALARKFGLEDKQVQTSSMEIEPHYKSDYADRGPGEFIAYSVEKTIVFTLNKTDQLESLVTEGLMAGANEIESITFESTELRKHMDEARVLAILAAREKAELLAGTLGMSIGFPLKITEEQQRWQAAFQTNIAISYESPPSDKTSAPTFALGQISITAEVSVEFEMTPKAAEPQSTETHAESDTHGSAAAASASAAVTRDAHEGPGEINSPYGGKPSSVQ